MKKKITIRGVTIGEGQPKICVPITGCTLSEIKEETALLKKLDFDVVEWRVDFFENSDTPEEVLKVLGEIRSSMPNTPLIFTFRTKKEGGHKDIKAEQYIALNQLAAESGQVDLLDIELFSGEEIVKTLIAAAHASSVLVVLSNHDFSKTPSKEELISRLRLGQEWGGDLPKIAVMPTSAADVLTLLDATWTMYEKYADRPIITMSMAGKGMISRLAGEVFGSAMTFGAARKASAPGQIPASELRKILSLLNDQ